MVERDERNVRATKLGVSKGFAFAEFSDHVHVRCHSRYLRIHILTPTVCFHACAHCLWLLVACGRLPSCIPSHVLCRPWLRFVSSTTILLTRSLRLVEVRYEVAVWRRLAWRA